MKSLMFLWRYVAEDLATTCHTSALQDYKKLLKRVEYEGEEFLTITLPTLSVALENALDVGVWDPSLARSFDHRGGLPRFLGGFLDRVFDRSTGRLLSSPCIDSIFAVRQLSLMYKKILHPCSPNRVRDAMRGYVEVEKEVAEWNWYSEQDLCDFERMSTLLFGDVLSNVETALNQGELFPKHGPGATADKLRGNDKYRLSYWPLRLENVFSYIEYALPNFRYHLQVEDVTFLEPEAEIPVKVIAVPKTLKTPRIIAVEPTCMQYMQQAISAKIVEQLESPIIRGCTRENLVYKFIGFSNQNPNRVMAKKGSLDGSLATLDMSEASDRVSNKHVVALLSRFPHLSEAVQAVRSTKAYVDGFGVIPLSKYASMGSALTFPLEAMVFLTAICLGLERQASRQFTRKDIVSLRGYVRVYGDDIIVPTDMVVPSITALESLGLRVNSNKSFWKGKFRESCGGDFYDGEWVTPIYVRRDLPRSKEDVAEVESLVSFRNQLYQAGLWKATARVDEIIREKISLFPIIEPTSPLLGRYSFLPYQVERVSRRTHVPLVKGYLRRDRLPHSPLDGVAALHKCLMALERRSPSRSRSTAVPESLTRRDTGWLFPETVDSRHLQRAGRPQAAGMAPAWRTPY